MSANWNEFYDAIFISIKTYKFFFVLSYELDKKVSEWERASALCLQGSYIILCSSWRVAKRSLCGSSAAKNYFSCMNQLFLCFCWIEKPFGDFQRDEIEWKLRMNIRGVKLHYSKIYESILLKRTSSDCKVHMNFDLQFNPPPTWWWKIKQICY